MHSSCKALLAKKNTARKTIESYSFALRNVAGYFNRWPDELTRYFTHLIDTRSWSLIKVERNGIRC